MVVALFLSRFFCELRRGSRRRFRKIKLTMPENPEGIWGKFFKSKTRRLQ